MDHLTAAQIVDLIGGEDIPGARRHLEACSRCRELEAIWVRRMDSLREIEREGLDPAELHKLRVMYRQLGPKRAEGAHWLANLVRSSDRQPVAVRGAASGRVSEYEAGPYTLLVRVGPVSRKATVSVHGQLTRKHGDAGVGTMALSAADGRAYVCDIDRFGEFHLREVTPGRYRALWWLDQGAVEVTDLEIGTDEAG
jgi:hypothetical protein